MVWLFIVVTAVVVVVIGLVAVGRVTFTLAEQPRPSSYELDEAVDFVADHLPEDATAQLTFDDVRVVLGLHLDYLEVKGVAFETGTVEERPEVEGGSVEDGSVEGDEPGPRPAGDGSSARAHVFPDWPEAAPTGPLIADDDEALPYILGRLAESDRRIDDVHVVDILEAERRYLEAIGAIGAPVPTPADPTNEVVSADPPP